MASLSDTSIKRPVLAIVMSLVVVLFGLIGFRSLGIREYPSIDLPVVTVQTNYVGANADIIESQITEPLEESINGISGIRTLSSSSRDGRSSITVEFELNVDIEAAANDVRDRVSRAQANLPADADPPVVSKADADANPIFFFQILSKQRSLLDLNDIGVRQFKERLQTIPGVSSVQIWGEKKYAMRLRIDPVKLSGYGLTAADIVSALGKQNIELPSGSVEGNSTELTVRTLGRLTTPAEFDNMILLDAADRVVKFSDVGYAELAPENERTLLKRDGVPMIALAIIPQPGSNQIEIVDEVNRRLQQIKGDLPPDVSVMMAMDYTRFVRRSIGEVEETIIIAFGLVALIIFAFLRDWRSTIIPLTAIPVSLVGTFFIMYLAGFSINVLTLLGIVLAIGLVVDDAIVVLENIYAKIEEGMPPYQAAFEGSREIYFAVISTTVTLAAVFLPVIFLQGITGRLFREFGIVVAGSVIISAFVSLTLTPMLSSRILKKSEHSWLYRKTEPFFQNLTSGYENALRGFLRVRWLAWVLMAVFMGIVVLMQLTRAIPSELAPLEDRGGFRMQATGPEGASFEYMLDYTDRVGAAIRKAFPRSEVRSVTTITSPGFGSSGTNNGSARVVLNDSTDRTKTQMQLADEVSAIMKQFPEARSFVVQDPTISTGQRGASLPVQFVIQATSFEKLREALPKFMQAVQGSPAFSANDVNLKFTKPEISISIDREKALNMGVSVQDVAQTLQLGLSGRRFGFFIMNGKQYQVIGQIDRPERNDVTDLKSLYVRSNRGELIQMDNLVSMEESSTPPTLYRFNRYSAATVSAGLAPGVSLGEGIDEMERIADATLDTSFTTALDGQSKEFRESSSSLYFAFGLALVLIYLILAAQFESFIDPLIILLTVPLALCGAYLSLWNYNQTMNIFSQIGIIVLIGLVTKNGILIVEFANQKKEEGADRLQAAMQAATSRFRPILMTSLCAVLGILPIALALGNGSESRVSMGIVVVGGLIFSTLLTLFVIPAIYTFMSWPHHDRTELEAAAEAADRHAATLKP